MTFNEASLRIVATGALKDGWYFELSNDSKAKLPFTKLDRQTLSCEYESAPYVVTATQGAFSVERDSSLRITPGAEGIALDFSTR